MQEVIIMINYHYYHCYDDYHDCAQGSYLLQELATDWPATLLNLRLMCKRSPRPWFVLLSPSSLSSLSSSSSSPPCSGVQHFESTFKPQMKAHSNQAKAKGGKVCTCAACQSINCGRWVKCFDQIIHRLEICQKNYTTQFSGERILHTENA